MNIKKLKIKLIEKDLTVPDLAEKIGISQASLYVKFKGERDFSYGEIMAIKKALDLSVDEFNEIFLS